MTWGLTAALANLNWPFYASKRENSDSRLIETHPSSFRKEQKRVRQKSLGCVGVMRGVIIFLFVWLVPSREAPQMFLTHRGRPKDSHDPQSASVCVRRMWRGGVLRRQHDGVQTVPPIVPTTPRLFVSQPTRPSARCVWKNAQWSGRQSRETSLCCRRHRTLISGKQAGNDRHTMHFRPLGVDLKSRLRFWKFITREKECMFTVSDYFLLFSHENRSMLGFFLMYK